MSKLSGIVKYHSGTWEQGFNHKVAVRRLQESEKYMSSLIHALSETCDTLSAILEDPSVVNVYRCHVSEEDIKAWSKLINYEQN